MRICTLCTTNIEQAITFFLCLVTQLTLVWEREHESYQQSAAIGNGLSRVDISSQIDIQVIPTALPSSSPIKYHFVLTRDVCMHSWLFFCTPCLQICVFSHAVTVLWSTAHLARMHCHTLNADDVSGVSLYTTRSTDPIATILTWFAATWSIPAAQQGGRRRREKGCVWIRKQIKADC
jgi:hypothetical protein